VDRHSAGQLVESEKNMHAYFPKKKDEQQQQQQQKKKEQFHHAAAPNQFLNAVSFFHCFPHYQKILPLWAF
jgi:hypothetical protein